jgi:RND family efflux transporter MFP subunit
VKDILAKILNSRICLFVLAHKKLSVLLGVILLILGGILWPKPQPPLETATVGKTTIAQSISASGSVDSSSSVNLNFITSGKLVYLGAKKGDVVTPGQTIATLDQRTTEKNLEIALSDYTKTLNSFEQSKDDHNVKSVTDATTDSLKRILENNQNDLNKAVASVELQSLAKEASVLSTPIGGIITRADVTTAGVNVSPTTTFVIADPEHLIFKTDVDESDIGKVFLNQAMNISLDAYPDEPVHVAVTSIDFASHTTSTGGNAYTVQADMPVSADNRYRIGMNGDAEVILAEKRNVLAIPLSSIVDDTYVYVQGEKLFEKRKVKLGIQNDTEAEVKEGLKIGEKVAISPSEVEKRQNIKRPDSSQ